MDTVFQEIWATLGEEFSDLSDAAQFTRILSRLVVAALLGGALGWEREAAGKAAGLRTHMLVSIGAALFVLIPEQAGMDKDGISRIIQGLVTGIGFIGAGAILKVNQEREIHGLTTAAGLWLTAAIGIAAGLGRETSAVLGTILALLVLWALRWVDEIIDGKENAPAEQAASKETKDPPKQRKRSQ